MSRKHWQIFFTLILEGDGISDHQHRNRLVEGPEAMAVTKNGSVGNESLQRRIFLGNIKQQLSRFNFMFSVTLHIIVHLRSSHYMKELLRQESVYLIAHPEHMEPRAAILQLSTDKDRIQLLSG